VAHLDEEEAAGVVLAELPPDEGAEPTEIDAVDAAQVEDLDDTPAEDDDEGPDETEGSDEDDDAMAP
jgi:hypothetical protein